MRTLLALAAAATAAAVMRNTFHKDEFLAQGRAPADAKVTFSAALPRRNIGWLEAKTLEISNPLSSTYGEWLSNEEILDMTAPSQEVRGKVHRWFTARGASCEHWPNSLRCTATVGQVESMFATEMTSFFHTHTKKVLHRVAPDASFTMPSELAEELLFTTMLLDFPTRRMRLGSGINSHGPSIAGSKAKLNLRAPGAPVKAAKAPAATDYTIALESVISLYGLAGVKGAAASTTSPAEFQSDAAITEADIKDFCKEEGATVWNITHKTGPFTGSDTEATLDGEFIAGVGAGNSQYWWTEATGVGWMFEWTEELAKAPAASLPAVFSVSWGWSEADQCDIDPGVGGCGQNNTIPTSHKYVATCNAGFAAATARGISILVSSGDSGAHGRTDGGCASKKTLPDWPTASQWITAVGATQLIDGKEIANPTSAVCKSKAQGPCAGSGTEVVASTGTAGTPALIVSGGGFSNVAPQPTWQQTAVAAYLASGALIPPAADFNSTGRGYPDIAAIGHNVLIYESGPIPVDGTSCSAPIMGGVIGLANAARLAAGKKVLGFLNPAIYQIAVSTPAAFNDVVTGDNTCTEDGCVKGCTGYGAIKGWDATTGFGTPNVPAMIAALAAL